MENLYNPNLSQIIIQTKDGYQIKNLNEKAEKKEIYEEEKIQLFPQGTVYEKELNLNFKYFNIFWFDPNKSHDFDIYQKCFEKVQFYKAFDLESIIKFFQKESSIEEWIIITPGSKGEEIIKKLQENKSIKAFFIFCNNPEKYEELSKKYEKIKIITNKHEELTKKSIDFNKDYSIPIFKYDENEVKKKCDFDFNFGGLKSKNNFALQSVLRESNELIKAINKNQNKYNIFCMKTLKYFKEEKCLKDFEETIKDENVVFYKYVENIKLEEKERLKKIINFVKNITLISLYFNKYPYIYNLFSYNEILELLKDNITPKNYMDLYNKSVYNISENLYEKLNRGQSIIREKEYLKQIQTFSILFTFFGLLRHRHKDFIDFYQIINFYRDIDFCLKFLIFYIYLVFNDKKNIFMNDLYSAINVSEFRINKIFLEYANVRLKTFKLSLRPEEQKTLDESLTIKDFIVIGDNNFNKKIKGIENDINYKTIKYLKIDEISNYIMTKNDFDCENEKENCIVTFFYYIIIKAEDFLENYGKIILLSAELGLSFIVIVFIENENKILFNKIPIKMSFIPIILVYSSEDIIKYLSKKIHCNIIENFKELLENDPELLKFLKIPIPKINFNNNNNEDYQDGCFELGETFMLI